MEGTHSHNSTQKKILGFKQNYKIFLITHLSAVYNYKKSHDIKQKVSQILVYFQIL